MVSVNFFIFLLGLLHRLWAIKASHQLRPIFTSLFNVTHLTLEGRLVRPLSLRRDSGKMPSLATLPVHQRSVLHCSVVPGHDSTSSPLDSGVEVCAPGDVLVEEVEDGIGFLLLEADDVAGDYGGVSTGLG